MSLETKRDARFMVASLQHIKDGLDEEIGYAKSLKDPVVIGMIQKLQKETEKTIQYLNDRLNSKVNG